MESSISTTQPSFPCTDAEMFEASKYEVIVLLKKMLSKQLIPQLFTGYEKISLFTKSQDDLQIVTKIDQETLSKLMVLYIKNEAGLHMYNKMMIYLSNNVQQLIMTDIFVPLMIMLNDFKKNRLFKKCTSIQLITKCSDDFLDDISNLGFDLKSNICLNKIKSLISQNKVDYQIQYNFDFQIGNEELSTSEQQKVDEAQQSYSGIIVIRVNEKFVFDAEEKHNGKELIELLNKAIKTQKIMFKEFEKRFDVILPDYKIKKVPIETGKHFKQLKLIYRPFEDFNFDHQNSSEMFQFNLKSEKLQLKCVFEKSEYLSDTSDQEFKQRDYSLVQLKCLEFIFLQDLLIFENEARKFQADIDNMIKQKRVDVSKSFHKSQLIRMNPTSNYMDKFNSTIKSLSLTEILNEDFRSEQHSFENFLYSIPELDQNKYQVATKLKGKSQYILDTSFYEDFKSQFDEKTSMICDVPITQNSELLSIIPESQSVPLESNSLLNSLDLKEESLNLILPQKNDDFSACLQTNEDQVNTHGKSQTYVSCEVQINEEYRQIGINEICTIQDSVGISYEQAKGNSEAQIDIYMLQTSNIESQSLRDIKNADYSLNIDVQKHEVSNYPRTCSDKSYLDSKNEEGDFHIQNANSSTQSIGFNEVDETSKVSVGTQTYANDKVQLVKKTQCDTLTSLHIENFQLACISISKAQQKSKKLLSYQNSNQFQEFKQALKESCWPFY